jgi:predicted dehydrogenase
LGIPGVEVTHVWCDDPADTARVAEACYITNQLERAADAIGQVDAVIIATDIGHEHVERAAPFIEAGLPVFIDKPLTDRMDHLDQFIEWDRQGKTFMSSSAMRYSPPLVAMRKRMHEVGDPRLIMLSMCKRWETYGIHALEAVYPLLRPGGWESVRNAVEGQAHVVHVHHADSVEVLLPTIKDMVGSFGCLTVCGTKGHLAAQNDDTFTAFKAQLTTFVDYLRTGRRPVPFEHLVEQMRIVIAGIQSGLNGGRPIRIETNEPIGWPCESSPLTAADTATPLKTGGVH